MIGSLRGELLDRTGTELLVEVGGLGYRVQVTPDTAAGAGEPGGTVFVHVHHHRREDAETLYGFSTAEERRVFETLIGTHGVGPSLALAVLSVHDPAALRRAVASEDVAALCLVPGVGRKTAARLLVELASRLEVDISAPAGVPRSTSAPTARDDVRDALSGLGYGPEEVARIVAELPDEGDPSDLLREALRRLAAA